MHANKQSCSKGTLLKQTNVCISTEKFTMQAESVRSQLALTGRWLDAALRSLRSMRSQHVCLMASSCEATSLSWATCSRPMSGRTLDSRHHAMACSRPTRRLITSMSPTSPCKHQTQSHTHSHLTALFPGLPRWALTRKVKPIQILLKQETVSGSGISWAICKSALRSRQITTPAPHHSVFYRPDALPTAQPTESKHWRHNTNIVVHY